MTQTKYCKSKFHTDSDPLELSAFTKDKYRKGGHSDTCKECARKRKKDWLDRVYAGDATVQSIQELRVKHVASGQRRRQEKGLAYCLWFSAKHRAKKMGREFSLTVTDVIIPSVCPILNLPLITSVAIDNTNGTKDRPANYPTVDRIDSTRGYTPDNIQVISWRANNLKNNATLLELVALGQFAVRQLAL